MKNEIYQIKTSGDSMIRELNIYLFQISKRLDELSASIDDLTTRIETLEDA